MPKKGFRHSTETKQNWYENLRKLRKDFDSIEEDVYRNFGGHLVHGYMTDLDQRFRCARNILDNFLKE